MLQAIFENKWHIFYVWLSFRATIVRSNSIFESQEVGNLTKKSALCLLTIVQGRLLSLEGAVKASRRRPKGWLSWGGFIFRGLYKGYIRSGFVTSSRIYSSFWYLVRSEINLSLSLFNTNAATPSQGPSRHCLENTFDVTWVRYDIIKDGIRLKKKGNKHFHFPKTMVDVA
jgi:hypothetical protein